MRVCYRAEGARALDRNEAGPCWILSLHLEVGGSIALAEIQMPDTKGSGGKKLPREASEVPHTALGACGPASLPPGDPQKTTALKSPSWSV